MKKLLIAASAFAIGLSAAAPIALAGKGGVPNENASDNAVGNTGGNNGNGLSISGDNGRVDNGFGNGGENVQGNTPNANGENGRGDNDDDHGSANENRPSDHPQY